MKNGIKDCSLIIQSVKSYTLVIDKIPAEVEQSFTIMN